ncbi:hypothetical protein D1AOALGA4SA_9951 [Olavius algarvensis Delta 1 endosymbiont]|nr:hypothetical protein D1AOALGA4SA_9951 [Olavius algarvensis Delta 1 endosymbiont]
MERKSFLSFIFMSFPPEADFVFRASDFGFTTCSSALAPF